ncbi:putative dsRNA-specific ribonuclease III [Cafeteria roenbergensis virus]|uniref:Putative dsRNA-specific ribonuclease III n=1 Tax=Cafeteria roenbergensis virus (strain BV-PW1) TaxID=693272 RepID=E3T4V2_CROVB|nr:putative dsRNA-specific ribonuclease III [Cafeteria roenbergensis virus BV-PW1]ADO67215.1 putative dsRNA-specific ribonuclease III [Cafeteria roenbergensis virus BV-PW1]
MTKTGLVTLDGISIKKEDGTEETYMIPYNENNILINDQDVISLLAKYQVKLPKVYHIEYFQESMTHKSYLKKDIFSNNILVKAKKELGNPEGLLELRDKSYERLEYLGDRVIKLIVSMYLFHRYPKQDEGFMTKLQTVIEDKNNLSKMSRDMGLSKYFIISKQIENIRGREAEKFNEDIFEAFFGALYLSNGFNSCLELLLNLLESQIDYAEKLYRNKNYKDQLLRYYHSQKWGYPEYYQIGEFGPSHKRNFIMGVKKDEHKETIITENNKLEIGLGYGVGNKKRDAEQSASKMALILLGCLKEDQYLKEDIYYPKLDEIKKENKNDDLNKQNREKNIEEINETRNILNHLIANDENLILYD